MDFDIYNFFIQKGFSDSSAALINLGLLLLIVIFLTLIVSFVSRLIIKGLFRQLAKRTKSKFDDFLIRNKVPTSLAYFPPLFFLIWIFPKALAKFPSADNLLIILDILVALLTIIIIRKFFSTLKDYLKTLKNFKDKPIDSYIQVIMIFVWSVGIIIILSLASGQGISTFLTTIGAMSAIILLIFKDSILGFVTSIQITINDTVRIGDWITMKSSNADGDVIEINLSTVKVQNFDKTITTIPTYKLVSDSFINWRGMNESEGRRIKRSLLIKISSIKFLTEKELKVFEKIQLISDFIKTRNGEIGNENKMKKIDKSILLNGRNLTNLGIFRKYALEYLKSHKKINQDMTVMCRQLKPTSEGVPIEIYAFSKEKKWEDYEEITSDIFDHFLSSLPYFNLECFELSNNKIIRK